MYAIINAHPEFEITCLVRNKKKGALVKEKYPSTRLVYGDLDSSDLIAEESFKADIVCNWASCEHLASVQAIAEGLSRKPGDQFGTFIHVSGTDILCYPDLEAGTYGASNNKIFDDWDSIGELLSIKDTAPHQDVDMTVLRLGATKARTAIVCPPTIYGPGRGPGNQRSIQVPEMALTTLNRGSGVTVEGGQNIWNIVHIHDLSDLFLKLVEEAARGGGIAKWGNEGYYFVENGEVVWADVAKKIANEAEKQGYIKTTELQNLDVKAVDEIWPFASFFWGTNSRCKAIRARKVLNWAPTRPSLFDEIPDIVAAEATSMGLRA